MRVNDHAVAVAPWPGLWRRGLYAGLAAAAVNTGLYALGTAFGVFSTMKVFGPASAEPGLAPTLIVSVVAALAATTLYRALAPRLKHPMLVLCVVAVLVLLFSFIPPTAQTDWSRAQIAFVELMHIAVATAIISALWDWNRTRASRPDLS